MTRMSFNNEWEISVCGGCDLPVEACRCEPEDWVDSTSGKQLEPPSRKVRVAPVEDLAMTLHSSQSDTSRRLAGSCARCRGPAYEGLTHYCEVDERKTYDLAAEYCLRPALTRPCRRCVDHARGLLACEGT